MGVLSENPFICANDIYNKLKNQVDIFVLDFHAEATAEKIAMGHYMDGKYNIAIVFTSSLEGDHFNGAIGSTLLIDEAELIYHSED